MYRLSTYGFDLRSLSFRSLPFSAEGPSILRSVPFLNFYLPVFFLLLIKRDREQERQRERESEREIVYVCVCVCARDYPAMEVKTERTTLSFEVSC